MPNLSGNFALAIAVLAIESSEQLISQLVWGAFLAKHNASGSRKKTFKFSIPKAALNHMPDFFEQTGRWGFDHARFKLEGGQITTPLGKERGVALDIFNTNLIGFEAVGKLKFSGQRGR